jgi:uncharacterized surface anchored protein
MREGKSTGAAFAAVMQLIFIIVGQALAIQGQHGPEEETGRIHGVVVDPQGIRFPGVGVTITHQTSQTEYSLRTNSSGEYNFTELASGSYDVLLKAPGEFKLLKILSVEVVAGKTTTLESRMPVCDTCDHPEGAYVVIQPTSGDIRGVVRDDPGATMAGVVVTLLSKPPSSLERKTKTNSEGEYRFIDLRPGKYGVRLGGKQLCARTVSAKVVVGKTTNLKTRLKTCSVPGG